MDSSMSFSITLIRHGETEENVRGIVQGQLDTKLNETGMRQARMLASNFPTSDFGLIYSSDLSRAYDTCQELVLGSPHSNGLSKDVIRTDQRLRERSFGDLQGQPSEIFIRNEKAAGKDWADYTPENGETPSDVRDRVLDFIQNRLIKKVRVASESLQNTKVLLVTHGGVIREFITYFRSFGHETFRNSDRVPFSPPNTSINEFLVHFDHENATFKIKTVELIKLHDVCHLDAPFCTRGATRSKPTTRKLHNKLPYKFL